MNELNPAPLGVSGHAPSVRKGHRDDVEQGSNLKDQAMEPRPSIAERIEHPPHDGRLPQTAARRDHGEVAGAPEVIEEVDVLLRSRQHDMSFDEIRIEIVEERA